MRGKLYAAGALMAGALIGLTAPGVANAKTKVKVGFATAMQVSYAPHLFAKGLGFFDEENLDVEFLEFQGSGVMLPQLANRSLTFGYPNPDILILSNEPGKDPLPIRFFFNGTPSTIWEFAVPADSPVRTIADLQGRKLGVGAMTFGNIPITRALLKENGLEAGKDVDLVPVGIGAPAFLALNSKRVDALNLFDTQHLALENTGTKIRRLPIPEKYASLFANGYVAHVDTLKESPAVVEGYGRAMARGLVACHANVEGCIRNFWNLYPSHKPVGGEEQAQLDNAKRVVGYRMNKLFELWAGKPIGGYTDAGWQNFIDVLNAAGQLSTTSIAMDRLYDGSHVEAFNRFDVEATAAAGRAFK